MLRYRKPRRTDWFKTVIYIAAYLVVIGFSSFYLLFSYWYVWAALAISGLMILVSWHANATVYHCSKCGYDFEISLLTDFFSPHGVDRTGGWTYLKCPNCSNLSRMKILVKTTDKK
jgi:DNA-directed RNA polymerase subunit RPC12/RpoP